MVIASSSHPSAMLGRVLPIREHNKFDFAALSDEPMRVVARRRHVLTRRRRVDWNELVRWPWVLQTIRSPARVLLEDAFARAGVSTPEDMIECTSIFATLQLVQSSEAVAMLPESVVRDHVKARRLRDAESRASDHDDGCHVQQRTPCKI